MSDLTVVLINKNSGKYIRQTCLSILSQNFENYRVFVLDSGSTDNSIDKIKSLKNEKIEIFNLNKNINPPEAYLHGIKNVKTKYITFTTSTDGYIDNEWFSAAISELEADQKLSFVYANSLQRKNNERLGNINQEFYLNCKMPSHENFLPFYLATNYHINELNCIWSTKVINNLVDTSADALHSFDPNFDLFETLEFLAIKKGFLGKFINTIANYGREHEKSITEKFSNMDNIVQIRKKKFADQRKFIFKHFKNMTFKDRNIKEISYINSSSYINFYLSYIFYMFFFPQFKKTKPFYSLHFLFKKFFDLSYGKFWIRFLNAITKKLTKNKFFIDK